ncbi:MAG: MYXO-CTERM sorting domain-containing protein, partial [Planctomycetota bacterium]
FSASASDEFRILTAADVTGTFDTLNVIDGGTFDIRYEANAVVLTNFIPTPSTAGLLALAGLAATRRRR